MHTNMGTIKNIVFDLGGVLMNFDFRGAAEKFAQLGLPLSVPDPSAPIPPTGSATQKTYQMINTYINGFIDEDRFADILQPYCAKNITHADIKHTLLSLDGEFPASRIESLLQLHRHYKVYLLSNINHHMWQRTLKMLADHHATPSDCFDTTFLSYELHMAKPSPDIYRLMIDQTHLVPNETIYFDDLSENIEAGQQFGLQSVLVESNNIEQCPAYLSLLQQDNL